MPRILFDQDVPVGLRRHLPYEVATAYENGWHELRNGELLAAAEQAGFDIFLTCDQSIRHKQDLARRSIAVVVLLTNHRDLILRQPCAGAGGVGECLFRLLPGSPLITATIKIAP